MHHFTYKKNRLYCEDVSVASIADEVGTPLYLYSYATIKRHFSVFDNAFKELAHLTCFSVKSNSNLAILKLLALQGGGADIVSAGELFRALRAGMPPEKIVFSGVGKTPHDIEQALQSDILMFNVESEQELQTLDRIARDTGKRAPIAIRINPDIAPKTHPYVVTGFGETKFGIPIDDSPAAYELAQQLDNIDVKGISCHIGSQLTEIEPFLDAMRKLRALMKGLEKKDISISYLNIGGGLGITYDDENPPHPSEYAAALKKTMGANNVTLILEPGRVIIGNAGIMITRVLYTKSTPHKRFVVVDAGMNDLIRPALYNSFHTVQPVEITSSEKAKGDLVGPVCETGDFFARDREMASFQPGDLVAVMSSGAYGFSMASNYNSRPRPAEVMVRGNLFSVIRSRETYDDLVKGEFIPEFLGDEEQ
ncbi:MAG: diaminopimelate decarboxylase [Deltaproteobacteria bacterium]|nr:MAG: diaminopimelate decarboxylase [Deltaproteobacteria bacterium]